MFLEKLVEWAVEVRDRLLPFVVIDVYEGGGVLRLGKYARTLGPGFHWKWPVIERVMEVTTIHTTLRLPPQSLTTKDGREIVTGVIVAYEIKDVEKFIRGIFDQKDVLADTTMGAVFDAVRDTTLATLLDTGVKKRVLDDVREECNQYGFKIKKITFTDLARMRSIRLLQGTPKDIDN